MSLGFVEHRDWRLETKLDGFYEPKVLDSKRVQKIISKNSSRVNTNRNRSAANSFIIGNRKVISAALSFFCCSVFIVFVAEKCKFE